MYLDFYGLNQKPFENTPDPSFFYYSSDHREALAAIHYGVEEDKGLIVISGDVGTGKTTLIQTYLNNIPPSIIALYVDYPFISMSQLIKYLADKIGIDNQKLPTLQHLVEVVTDRLSTLSNEGKKVVLIFDEAQHLSMKTLEFIRLLSNLQTHEKKLINIVLVGQIELLKKIEAPELRQLRQRILIQRVLRPLSFSETVNYIQHRLLVAGASTNTFTKGAMRFIFKKSGGIPRLINAICDNALLGGYVAGARTIKPSIVKLAIKESLPAKRSIPVRGIAMVMSGLVIGISLFLIMKMGGFSSLRKSNTPSPENSSFTYEISSDILKPFVAKIDEAVFDDFKVIAQDVEQTIESKTISEGMFEGSHKEVVVLPPDLEAVAEEVKFTRGIKPQEALLKIVAEVYGKSNETLLDIVLKHNPSIKNIDFIYAGQKIVLPKLTPESFIFKSGDGKYFIHYYSTYRIDKATKKLQEISVFNYQASIVSIDSGGKVMYRIYVGPLADLIYAKKVLASLPHDHLPIGLGAYDTW